MCDIFFTNLFFLINLWFSFWLLFRWLLFSFLLVYFFLAFLIINKECFCRLCISLPFPLQIAIFSILFQKWIVAKSLGNDWFEIVELWCLLISLCYCCLLFMLGSWICIYNWCNLKKKSHEFAVLIMLGKVLFYPCWDLSDWLWAWLPQES